MIVVSVILVSARTGKATELARAQICNDGTSQVATIGNYDVRTLRGRSMAQLNRFVTQREGKLLNFPRNRLHVWSLVAAALRKLGYGEAK